MTINLDSVLKEYNFKEEFHAKHTPSEKVSILDKTLERLSPKMKVPNITSIALTVAAVVAVVGAIFALLYLPVSIPLLYIGLPLVLVAGGVTLLGVACKFFYDASQIHRREEILIAEKNRLLPKYPPKDKEIAKKSKEVAKKAPIEPVAKKTSGQSLQPAQKPKKVAKKIPLQPSTQPKHSKKSSKNEPITDNKPK